MRVFAVALLFLFALTSCAQSKLGVVKSYAYSRPDIAGIVTEDDRHKAPDTLYFVYLETKPGWKQSWKKGFIKNRTYNVVLTKVESPFAVGVLKDQSDTTMLKVKRGNSLYQLVMEKSDEKSVRNSSGKRIVLMGMHNSKTVSLTVKPITALKANEVM